MSLFFPRMLSQLKVGERLLWGEGGGWKLYEVTQHWGDGALVSCLHPSFSTMFFLPSTQWVACPVERVQGGGADWVALLGSLWARPTLCVTLTGASMEPWLPCGTKVEVAPVTASMLHVGQVVTWAQGTRWNTHRIRLLERDECGQVVSLQTRGDALDDDDPPISPAQLLGRVVCAHVHGRRRDVEGWPWRGWVETRWALRRMMRRFRRS